MRAATASEPAHPPFMPNEHAVLALRTFRGTLHHDDGTWTERQPHWGGAGDATLSWRRRASSSCKSIPASTANPHGEGTAADHAARGRVQSSRRARARKENVGNDAQKTEHLIENGKRQQANSNLPPPDAPLQLHLGDDAEESSPASSSTTRSVRARGSNTQDAAVLVLLKTAATANLQPRHGRADGNAIDAVQLPPLPVTMQTNVAGLSPGSRHVATNRADVVTALTDLGGRANTNAVDSSLAKPRMGARSRLLECGREGLGRSLRVGVVDCLESQKKAGFLDDLDGLDAMRRARLTTSTRWRHPRRHPARFSRGGSGSCGGAGHRAVSGKQASMEESRLR